MKVRSVLEKNVITLRENTTYEEAAKILHDSEISGAPVLDEKNDLVGILSEKDLLKVLFPYYASFSTNPESYLDFEERENKIKEVRDKPISNFMAKKVISVDPETPIIKAAGTMLARGFHLLPVVENGKLIGIVSRENIYRAILRNHLGF